MIPSVKTIERMLAEVLEKEYGPGAHSVAMAIRFHLEKAVDHESVDIAMEAINLLLHGYGIEAIRDNKMEPYYRVIGVLYVNMGDTYATTVCYDTREDRFYITSWGDIVEGDPKRFDI